MEIFKNKNVSDSSIQELDKIINFWAETISQELSERRFLEVDDFSIFAKTRLFQAIFDCVKLDIQEIENKRIEMVETYGKLKGKDKFNFGTKIARVNLEQKRANRLKHSLRDYDEYKQLTKFITENYGWDVMKDFFDNYLDRKENYLNKCKLNNTDGEN